MKNLLIAVILLVVCAVPAFSGTKFLVGGGADMNMYNTSDKFKVDAAPTMVYGLGTSAGNVFGGITPDEVFLIGSYSRAKLADTSAYVSTYSGSIAGIWYLADSLQKVQPFFLVQTNLEAEDAEVGSTTWFWNGQVGLGAGYPLTEKADLWAAASLKMGAVINADIAAGLKFEF